MSIVYFRPVSDFVELANKIFEEEKAKILRLIKPRDILLENPELIVDLNAIKMKYDGKSMDEYRKEKADFFQKLREIFYSRFQHS